MTSRRERRDEPRGEDMHPRELADVAELNRQLFIVLRDALDLQRGQRSRFQLPRLAEHITVPRLARSDPKANVLVARFQPEIEVTGGQTADREESVLDRKFVGMPDKK